MILATGFRNLRSASFPRPEFLAGESAPSSFVALPNPLVVHKIDQRPTQHSRAPTTNQLQYLAFPGTVRGQVLCLHNPLRCMCSRSCFSTVLPHSAEARLVRTRIVQWRGPLPSCRFRPEPS